jgi:hypothetical protein
MEQPQSGPRGLRRWQGIQVRPETRGLGIDHPVVQKRRLVVAPPVDFQQQSAAGDQVQFLGKKIRVGIKGRKPAAQFRIGLGVGHLESGCLVDAGLAGAGPGIVLR